MKDYGNISSANNSVDDLIDDLYNFEYNIKTELPLDIINNDQKNKQKHLMNEDNTDDIDLSVLTRVLLPQNVLKNPENNKVWTFDSILNDRQSTFNKN